MEKQTVRLTIRGEQKEYPYGTSYKKIVADNMRPGDEPVLLVSENNRLRELHHSARRDCDLRMITMRDRDGFLAYTRSLSLMMVKAVSDCYPDQEGYQVTVHFVVSDGLYCTLHDPKLVTDEFLNRVLRRMDELRDAALPIRKESVSTWAARVKFRDSGLKDKEKLFRYRLSSRTNMYDLDGYSDYFYGYMVPDTSCLKLFDLVRYAGGFVLTCPNRHAPDRIEAFEPVDKLFRIQNRSLEWGVQMGIRTVADLNDLIVAGRSKELILTQEAYHEKQIAEIAQYIASDERRKIVMIAGPSSSSKTTFSHRLSTQLSVYGLTPHPIPVDDYFVNRVDTPKDEDGNYNFECLEAIDIKQFNEDMTALLEGRRVELPTFNFKTGLREYKGKSLQLGAHDILVIEGIHCLNDRLSYSLPKESMYKIYISALTQLNVDEHNRIATTDGRLIRRMVRDARTRGTSATGTISMWPSVRRGEENHIFPFQESADVMFNSALIYELAVLKTYAEPLLFGIDPDSEEYTEAKRLLKFLDYFVPIPADEIPRNSLIREFIGGSCFDV